MPRGSDMLQIRAVGEASRSDFLTVFPVLQPSIFFSFIALDW